MVGIRGFEPLWLHPLSKLFLDLRDVCPYRLLQSPQSQVPTRQYVAAPIITLPPSIFKVTFASFPKFLVTVTESPESTTARNAITSKLLQKLLYVFSFELSIRRYYEADFNIIQSTGQASGRIERQRVFLHVWQIGCRAGCQRTLGHADVGGIRMRPHFGRVHCIPATAFLPVQ